MRRRYLKQQAFNRAPGRKRDHEPDAETDDTWGEALPQDHLVVIAAIPLRDARGWDRRSQQRNSVLYSFFVIRFSLLHDRPREHRSRKVSDELRLHDESARSVADEGKRVARNQCDRRR